MSCSSGGSQLLAGGTELQQSLPPLESLRAPAELLNTATDGAEFTSKSDNAAIDGTALSLSSTQQDPSWGIWQLVPADDEEVVNLQVLLDVSAGNEAWIALANHSSGRWDFSGPHSGGFSLELDQASHVSEAGSVFVAVLAAGGDSLDVLRLLLRTDRRGWQPLQLETGGSSVGAMAIFDMNGRPAIAFQHVEAGDMTLNIALCDDALGLSQTDWSFVSVDATDGAGAFVDAMLVDGKPAIAYQRGATGDMYYIRSATAGGADSADWNNPVEIMSEGEVGLWPSMAIVLGNPAICFQDSTEFDLWYTRSSDADGEQEADWLTRQPIDDFMISDAGTCLRIVDGNPAVTCYHAGAGGIRYRRSSSSTGSLLSDWLEYVDIPKGGQPVAGQTRIVVSDGRPAVLSTNPFSRYLLYSQSSTADGMQLEDWPEDPLAFTESGFVNLLIAATEIDGRPAAAIHDFGANAIRFLHCNSPDGMAGGTAGWTESTVVASGASPLVDMAEVGSRPVLAWAGGNKLFYAVLLD
ncbi:hypothetical protein KDL44_03910 [bacterium]|nr:hypothetical protein [bacterium]